jgi:hypothetical protein
MDLHWSLIVIHSTIDKFFLVLFLGPNKEVGSFLASFNLHEFVEFQYFAFGAASIVFRSFVEDRLYISLINMTRLADLHPEDDICTLLSPHRPSRRPRLPT